METRNKAFRGPQEQLLCGLDLAQTPSSAAPVRKRCWEVVGRPARARGRVLAGLRRGEVRGREHGADGARGCVALLGESSSVTPWKHPVQSQRRIDVFPACTFQICFCIQHRQDLPALLLPLTVQYTQQSHPERSHRPENSVRRQHTKHSSCRSHGAAEITRQQTPPVDTGSLRLRLQPFFCPWPGTAVRFGNTVSGAACLPWTVC